MKTRIALSVLFVILFAFPALGHDFWAGAQPAQNGQPLTAILGFGHNFPVGEEIKAEQIGARYNPLRLIGASGDVTLKNAPEAKLFLTEQPLPKGVYLVLASTVPSFRSATPSGPVPKPKNEVPGATSCRFSSSFGKGVVNIGGATDTALIVKPVGHNLEIVPQVNPATVKVGQKLPVKILLRGRPLPGARLEAYFAGFSDEDSYAFVGQADQQGLINIIPLKDGQWLAKVSESRPYSETAKCDTENFNASLSFTIFD